MPLIFTHVLIFFNIENNNLNINKKTSPNSVPNAKNLPDGDTSRVNNLNGKSIDSTGSATSQSQN